MSKKDLKGIFSEARYALQAQTRGMVTPVVSLLGILLIGPFVNGDSYSGLIFGILVFFLLNSEIGLLFGLLDSSIVIGMAIVAKALSLDWWFMIYFVTAFLYTFFSNALKEGYYYYIAEKNMEG